MSVMYGRGPDGRWHRIRLGTYDARGNYQQAAPWCGGFRSQDIGNLTFDPEGFDHCARCREAVSIAAPTPGEEPGT